MASRGSGLVFNQAQTETHIVMTRPALNTWLAGLAALCISLPASAATFGINLNEGFEQYDAGLANGAGANWVRGFVELRRFVGRYGQLKNGPTPVTKMADEMRGDAKIRALLNITGKSLIVNLKYDYANSNFPTGVAYDDMERVTQAFLDVVWDKADIIVTGNEPFIESINSDAQRGGALTTFYKSITNFAIRHRATKGTFRPIYVGAFNNLHQQTSNFPGYSNALLAYAGSTAGVAGVDVHAHVPGFEGIGQALDYAKARIGGKDLIVTEYSLIQYWRQHVDSPTQTSATFKLGPNEGQYNTARKFINYAMGRKNNGNAISLERWNAFLQAQPWYTSRQGFLGSAEAEMNARGVSKAMYALLNTQSSLTAGQDPWVLNPLYCTSVCPGNSSKQQVPWFGEFKNGLPH